MKKFILMAGLLLISTLATAQCWRCDGPPHSKQADCIAGASTGGCACRAGNGSGYRLCATCGVCFYGYCLYSCNGAQTGMGATASLAPPVGQVWSTSKKLSGRVGLQSPALAGVVAFAQSTLDTGQCRSWHGRAVDPTTGLGYDWSMLADNVKTEFSVISESGSEDRLLLTQGSWALIRDNKIIVTEKY